MRGTRLMLALLLIFVLVLGPAGHAGPGSTLSPGPFTPGRLFDVSGPYFVRVSPFAPNNPYAAVTREPLQSSDTNNDTDLYLFQANAFTRVNAPGGEQPNGPSDEPEWNPSGTAIVFDTQANNFVPGDTNGVRDVIVFDVATNSFQRASTNPDGTQRSLPSSRPSFSPDGNFIAFNADDQFLVEGVPFSTTRVLLRDIRSGTTSIFSANTAGQPANGPCSNANLAVLDDILAGVMGCRATNFDQSNPNGVSDIFFRRLGSTPLTTRVSNGPGGISPNGNSFDPQVVIDGQTGRVYVTYSSEASNLVPDDTNGARDIFLSNSTDGGATWSPPVRISDAPGGVQANGPSFRPLIRVGPEGTVRVSFHSLADNLVPGDTNQANDVFIRNLYNEFLNRESVATDGSQANGSSRNATIGQGVVGFESDASNLVPGDTNSLHDVFFHEIDMTGPTNPSVTPDRPSGSASNDNTPQFAWEGAQVMGESHAAAGASDPSGVDGYTYLLDHSTDTAPDNVKEAEETATGVASEPLEDGTWYFHFAVLDNEGNRSTPLHFGPFTIDRAAPVSARMGSEPAFQSAASFGVRWSASDSLSGIASFDVQYRRAPFNGTFSPFVTWKSRTTARSGTFPGRYGNTYCLRVRARDGAGNVTTYSPEVCTAVPVDDPTLGHSAGWSVLGGSSFFGSDYSRTTVRGATLSLAGALAKRIAVVLTRCPGCGEVDLMLGAARIAHLSLNSPTIRTKQIVTVATFSGVRSGTIRIVVTSSGRTVCIEGLGLSRR